MSVEASTVIGCCSWPIQTRLRVTEPSVSAVGVWSPVWQFCVLLGIRSDSWGKRHHAIPVLHAEGKTTVLAYVMRSLWLFLLELPYKGLLGLEIEVIPLVLLGLPCIVDPRM